MTAGTSKAATQPRAAELAVRVSDEVRHALLWTVACSLLFFWLFSIIVKGPELPPSYVTKVKVEKVCKFHGGYYPVK